MSTNEKGTHLTLEDRKIVQKGIENGSTKTSIANTLGKDNSTIGKEIALHRTLKSKCALPLECNVYKHCKLGRECTIACPKYVPFKCSRRDRSPGACNGCSNFSKCRFDKYWYDAVIADNEYKRDLVDSRQDFDLTKPFEIIRLANQMKGLERYQVSVMPVRFILATASLSFRVALLLLRVARGGV